MTTISERYLDLLRAALTDSVHAPPRLRMPGGWPEYADTMIGVRLDHLRQCVETVLLEDVPGDFLEAGVWRGGACIWMRALLERYGNRRRKVWVADSFCGLPAPNEKSYPADAGDQHHTIDDLAVSLAEVQHRFARYGYLDDRVKFLDGFFSDTLWCAPVTQLAILRLDGDMYGSTWETLEALYPKVSPGGFVIVDDWDHPAARKAVEDYCDLHDIDEAIGVFDGSEAWWRKEG